MPRITELPSLTALNLTDALALASKDNNNDDITVKLLISELASELMTEIDYASLTTSSKKIVNAINEVASSTYTEVSGTLTAGSTSLTLSDASILATSTFDIYVSSFGIQPTNAVVATGSITLTFLAQASDITVKVRVS